MPESTHAKFFESLEERGMLVNDISSLGWAFWPEKGGGFFNEHLLRQLADEIEKRNKPFWDEYEAYCLTQKDDVIPSEDFSMDFVSDATSTITE